MKPRIAVYTAIYGNKDALREPVYSSQDCDFYCFTDAHPRTSSIYTFIEYKGYHYDPTRNAKVFKVLPHRFLNYDYAMWIDASILIKIPDVRLFIESHLERSKMVVFKHHRRTSLEEEVQYCITHKRDDPEVIFNQYRSYLRDKYPDTFGLVELGVIVSRIHDPEVIAFNSSWWAEISTGSRRDQLSFNYVAWKQNFTYSTFQFSNNIAHNQFFEVGNHLSGDFVGLSV